MDKIFKLKIDAKNKNITTINGFKEFDNNSVLNIILLQNSLALDLSNCTVRINFLREDKRVLLYMADIVSAKEGKVSVKLSPEVLKKTGNVKADISVFDSNLLKITSATFNMKVEKSIFDDTYFIDKDLDLMQQEYARERERQKAESARSENELARITYEQQRKNNENTRNSNEEARKKAESTRVSEWNNVKKDATNMKNTLDTTIDTANKTDNNLKSTIAAGDKLKVDLNINSYVKNTEYEKYKREIVKEIKENTAKTITKETNILTLTDNIDGVANITLEGNTLVNLFNSPENFTKTSDLTRVYMSGGTINLKPNTTYSQILINWENGIEQFVGYTGMQDGTIVGYTNSSCIVFTTKDTTEHTWMPHLRCIDSTKLQKYINENRFKVMVLEGDWSNKYIPDYFEGIKSVGEEKNEIEVKSVSKNLFDKTKATRGRLSATIGDDFRILTNYGGWCTSQLIPVRENVKMRISGELTWIVLFDKNKKLVRLVSKAEFNGTKIGECYLGCYSLEENNNLSNVQLEEGTTVTPYEDYKEDKVIIDLKKSLNLKEPLRGLPNGTRDVRNSDGSVTKYINKIVLNGSEDWVSDNGGVKNGDAKTLQFRTQMSTGRSYERDRIDTFICNNFVQIFTYNNDIEGAFWSKSGYLWFRINKSKLSTKNAEGFKKWLKENPTTVIYESKFIVTETTGQPLTLKTFVNGHIYIDSTIEPYVTIKYPSNISSRISTVEEANTNIKNNLGGAWRTLLILADKELKMKSIKKIEVETTKDIKNKINEILEVW